MFLLLFGRGHSLYSNGKTPICHLENFCLKGFSVKGKMHKKAPIG